MSEIEISFMVGEWVRFSFNHMILSGQISEELFTREGEEGKFFSVRITLGDRSIEITCPLSQVKELKRVDPPLLTE